MYRRNALLLIAFLASANACFAQDTFVSNLSFGNWSDVSTWTQNGSPAVNIPTLNDNVTITAGDVVTLDITGANCNDLTVEAGAVFYANTPSTRLFSVYGNTISVDGAVGNGGTTDGIIFRLFGSNVSLGGSGAFDAFRLIKGGATDTDLTVSMDVNLRGSGSALYHAGTGSSDFNVTIPAGVTVDVVSGNVSLDGTIGKGSSDAGGTMTVDGTLKVGGILYLETNNTPGTGNLAELSINATGVVSAARARTSSSGTDRFHLNVAAGALLQFTSGDFGDVASQTVYAIDPDATVEFASDTPLTVHYPDADPLDADIDVDNIMHISGAGTKTLRDDFTVTRTLRFSGTADLTITVGKQLAHDGSTLEYKGTDARTVGEEWPTTDGPVDLIIDNAAGVTMSGDRTVEGSITFNDGDLDTDAYTLTLGATGSLVGEANAHRLVGTLIATRSDFTGAQDFGGIGFALAAGGTDPDAPVTVTRVTGNGGIVAVGDNESIGRQFDVSYGGSAFSKDLTISWFQAEDNGKTLTDMELWRFNGSTWNNVSPTPVDASATRSITETVTDLDLYLFTATDAFNALPVELVSFDAVADQAAVVLQWQTASETNNAGFEIQARTGAAAPEGEEPAWQVMGFVEGHGTTPDPHSYAHRVEALQPGRYVFRLKQIDYDGAFEYSPEVEVSVEVPGAVLLSAAFPNPFNPQTHFTLSVARQQQVRLEVYDVVGRLVAVLFDGVLPAQETRTFAFDGRDLSSGLYFYRATGEFFTVGRTMMLQK